MFLRVRMFMCVHLPGYYFFFSLVCRPSVCWAAILHCEYTLERSIFFLSLIYAGSVLQADQLLHGIFISFFVCHHFTSRDDSEWDEWKCNNIVTNVFCWFAVDQELHAMCLYVVSISHLLLFVINISLFWGLHVPFFFWFYDVWPRAIALYTQHSGLRA